MIKFSSETLLDELEQGLGDQGDLTLMIVCTKCDETFEIGKEGAAMAIATNSPFIEYLRWVQNSKCRICNRQESDDN